LAVAQWGPRKNLENTIRWWVEEFKDEEVGLIVKTSLMKNSIVDRKHTTDRLNALLSEYKDRKCKVHLLHGYMTPEEMTTLYQHEKVKGFISLAHGEGFGLPIFEAAYNGVPVIAPDWSGQKDYLYAERKVRKNKKNIKKVLPCFATVNYELKPIQPEVVWDGVLIAESSWCYPKEDSYKKALRKVYDHNSRHQKIANTLQTHIQDVFAEDKMYESFCNAIYAPSDEEQAWMEELSKIEIL
jgi:glycosyltransferase involved in cell wall biosynthesis